MPEPINEQENMFLLSLTAHMFLLGIKKIAGNRWVYDSNQSALNYESWANWTDRDPFPRAGQGNCVSMVRNRGNEFTGHRPQDWSNNNCEMFDQDQPKSLICQKSGK